MITEQKFKHILGVARKCEKIAKQQGYSEEFQRQMFLLGYLHDIGYEYGKNDDHNDIAVDILLNSRVLHAGPGYKYLNEIRMHGFPSTHPVRNTDRNGNHYDKPYSSDALTILNTADITTDSDGKECSVEERLSEVKLRYGLKSKQYKNLQELCKELNLI